MTGGNSVQLADTKGTHAYFRFVIVVDYEKHENQFVIFLI